MTPLEALADLRLLDPAIVDAELRPLVERLAARRRTCDGCGIAYIQKRHHRRARNFHAKGCSPKQAEVGGPKRKGLHPSRLVPYRLTQK